MPSVDSPRPIYLRWSVWIAYAVLFAVAIPWYWPAGDTSFFVGIPVWAAVSIVTSAVISVFTAWLLLTCWPSDEELDSEDS